MIYNFSSFHPRRDGLDESIHLRGAEASAESMGETWADLSISVLCKIGLGMVMVLPEPPMDTLAEDCD